MEVLFTNAIRFSSFVSSVLMAENIVLQQLVDAWFGIMWLPWAINARKFALKQAANNNNCIFADSS